MGDGEHSTMVVNNSLLKGKDEKSRQFAKENIGLSRGFIKQFMAWFHILHYE